MTIIQIVYASFLTIDGKDIDSKVALRCYIYKQDKVQHRKLL